MNKALRDQAMQLSPAERIGLAHDLWESVPADHVNLPPVTEAQLAEVERRLAEHRADPSSAIPWEEVRDRLRAKYG